MNVRRNGFFPLFAGVVFMMLSVVLLLSAAVRSVYAQNECPGVLPARLTVGQYGRMLPGAPNNIRIQPALNTRRVGQIREGEQFKVLSGPVCADNYRWWKIDLRGLVGWTAESGDGEYWLENTGIWFATPTVSVTRTPRPTLQITPRPTRTPTPGPHPTSSAEAMFMYNPPANVVPQLYTAIRMIPVWQEDFETNEAGWHLLTDGPLTRKITDGHYEMSGIASDAKVNTDTLYWEGNDNSWRAQYQYSISVDVQNLTPGLDTICAVLLLNTEGDSESLSFSFCRGGTVSLAAASNRAGSLVLRENTTDVMDGTVHRVSVVADGTAIYVYVDGQMQGTISYNNPWLSVGMGYAVYDEAPSAVPTVLFDALDISLPTACTLKAIITPQLLTVTRQSDSAPDDTTITLFYGYSQDWAENASTGGYASLENARLTGGDRVTGVPPLVRTVGCSRRTSIGFTIYEGEAFVDSFAVNLDADAWQKSPVTSTVTYSSVSGFNYTLTYTVALQEDTGTAVPLTPLDFSSVQIEQSAP